MRREASRRLLLCYIGEVVIAIFLTVVHVLVCVFLIIVVLLQSGKAADLAGAFGGMGSQTAFGPRGSATVLSKATTVSAIVFMITSMALSVVAQRGQASTGSILDQKPLQHSGTTAAPKKPLSGTINVPVKPAPAPANGGAAQSKAAPAQSPAKK